MTDSDHFGDVGIQVFDNLSAVREVWLDCESGFLGYPFQNYDWIRNIHHTVGDWMGIKPYVVLVTNAADLPVMIQPFGVRKRRGISQLTYYDFRLCDYNAPLIDDAFLRQIQDRNPSVLWRRILSKLPRTDFILLEKIPAFIHDLPNPFFRLPGQPHQEQGHFTRLEDDWPTYFIKKVGRRSRLEINRKKRRLSEMGHLRFIRLERPEDIKNAIEMMIEQKKRHLAEQGFKSIFNRDIYLDFYLHISQDPSMNNRLHLFTLQMDSDILACNLGIQFQNRYYFILRSYDFQKYQKYSIGSINTTNIIEWCFDNHIEICDFTVGDHLYKQRWCEQTMHLLDYYQLRTMTGFPFFAIHHSKYKLRQYPGIYNRIKKVVKKFQ